MDNHNNGSQPAGGADLKTFLVCGMTGVGKSTFINKVTGSQLSISGNIDSDTADVVEEGIPLIKVGDEYIQLVDTPGFGDSRETTQTAILRRISTWLAARHMSKLPVTGVIFLRPIHDVRVNQLEKALMAMFKNLCGKDCLDHIFLVITRWTSEPTENDEVRASELASRAEFFGTDGEKKVQVRRLNDSYSPEEAQSLVKSCAGLPPVTFRIQSEVVDQEKTLGQTQAGMCLGADQEEKLSGLEEKAKRASEYAAGAKKRLEEAEQEKIRLEEERAQEAEKSRKEAEAAEEARRSAEAERERLENERIEAEERGRREEEAAEEARRAAATENERLETERKEAEEKTRREEEAQRAAEEERAAEAERTAEEERARQENERNEAENILKGAEEFANAAQEQTQHAMDEVGRFGENAGKEIEKLFH